MSERSGLVRARERYASAKTFVGLFREFRAGLDRGGRQSDSTGIGTLLVVLCAVMVGHVEARPMSATKLALYTDLPRTTVLRKIKLLIEIGAVVRSGNVYCIAPARAKNPPATTSRSVRVLHEAIELLDRRNVLVTDATRIRPDRIVTGY